MPALTLLLHDIAVLYTLDYIFSLPAHSARHHSHQSPRASSHTALYHCQHRAKDPLAATAVPRTLCCHCRSWPSDPSTPRPAFVARHPASPSYSSHFGTTHVVQNGRTTLCPPLQHYLTTPRSHAEIDSFPLDYHPPSCPSFRNYRPRLPFYPKWLPHEASLRCDRLYSPPKPRGCPLLALLPPCVQYHLSHLATSHHASTLSNHLHPAPCTPDTAMALAAPTPTL